MRKLFDRLTATLKAFRNQRDDLLLLVPCADQDVALLLKAMRDLDRASPADLYLLFADDFTGPAQYLTALAERLQEEVVAVNEATGARLPLPPVDLRDAGKAARERLAAMLHYGQSLVDPGRGQRYVVGLGPMTINDPEAYVELLAHIAPRPDVLPWMRGGRIVARVPADFKLESSPLARAKRVRVEPFVIPPTAHEDELLSDASDPRAPLGERMQAEVELALLDSGHGRFEQATARFRKALAFFQWAEIPAMEGLILCGMGDMERRQENWQQAQHWYACAVVPAGKAGNPMLLATIVQNLAVVAFHEERWADAEERYTELTTLKRGMFDEVGLLESLEWRGVTQLKQEAYDRAALSFHEAALVCKTFDELNDRLPPMLTHLKLSYEKLGMHDELEEFDAEWCAS